MHRTEGEAGEDLPPHATDARLLLVDRLALKNSQASPNMLPATVVVADVGLSS